MANTTNTPWVYIKSPTPEEQAVVDSGYPYVSTNNLPAHGKLNPHGHNSTNTHIILEGSLHVVKHTSTGHSGMCLRGTTYGPGQPGGIEAKMDRNVCYEAVAGSSGCVFIEGHKQLSPTTRERFSAGGKIRDAPTGTHNQDLLVVTPYPAVECDERTRSTMQVVEDLA